MSVEFMSEQLSLPLDLPHTPEEIFARTHRRIFPSRPAPAFRVAYREWAAVRCTIRRTGTGLVEVDICDVLRAAPPITLEALAEILISRFYSRRPSREARACYLACTMAPDMRRRIEEARRTRGFKLMLPARGRRFDLEEIFARHNRAFFGNRLQVKQVGWSRTRSSSVLGHYDSAHNTITISRLLDGPDSPQILVEYVMFHEMLHVHYPVTHNHHRRVVHSPEFRAAEKQFPGYRQAQRLLHSRLWKKKWNGRHEGW